MPGDGVIRSELKPGQTHRDGRSLASWKSKDREGEQRLEGRRGRPGRRENSERGTGGLEGKEQGVGCGRI